MALTAADYLAQLQALLPHGPAWPRDAQHAFTRLLLGSADALSAAGVRAELLIDEADPNTANELLADWERVAGLPDACVTALGEVQTTAQRRAALIARLTAQGGQTPAYYVAVAELLGYTVTLVEYREHSVDSDVDTGITGPEWAHAWALDTPDGQLIDFTVDDTVDDPFTSGGNALLECVMTRIKPAHTTLIINYI